ncbi:hypothetical protein LOK49_LG10G02101 [Camellia lanceoleosa]|uniref:Uncharacterized protein n=1 Tax=Camellia lanceoleosa TaxID=1840588 RepID=A0ACC0G9Y8_9ERIC|nr:hypothetical protein LOK49_LG10G02101 [Camellia lanceoleosa]
MHYSSQYFYKSSVPLPDPLNDYDSLVLRYAFDESLPEGEYRVRMKLHYVEAQSATRKELCSLKPYRWISSCVQSLHKLLQYAHGEDYVQDVSSFSFQWLEDMPRQDNSYDCGLFVIKYMQGKPLPSGVIKVSGMPTFGIPVQDGGIGFDYRLHMTIADKWIKGKNYSVASLWHYHNGCGG